jgi:hypothetical protein
MWNQKQLMLIVWPAFMSACLLELVVFALVDPLDLHWSGRTLPWSRQGVYTAAFFVFWAAGLLSGALTTLLRAPMPKVSDCPFPVAERPDDCPHG